MNPIKAYRMKKMMKILFAFLCVGGIMSVFVIFKLISTFIEQKVLVYCISIYAAVFNIVIAYVFIRILYWAAEVKNDIVYIEGGVSDIYNVLCEGCGAFLVMQERESVDNSCKVPNESEQNGERVVKSE